jgi:hypothetical protein
LVLKAISSVPKEVWIYGGAGLLIYFFGYGHASRRSKKRELEAKLDLERAHRKADKKRRHIIRETNKRLKELKREASKGNPSEFMSFANRLLSEIFSPRR